VVRECARVPPSDPNLSWLHALYQRQPALSLAPLDLCFLVALQRRAQELGLAALDEQQLLDIFAAVCGLVAPETEHVATRATHGLRRLREQQLLVRVDGAGISRAGEFALSRLGSSIVDFYVEEEALSPDHLDLLARTLLGSLTETRERARRAQKPRDWQAGVVGPLRITTGDLILGIERRQRGLDIRQEEFRREISRSLASDWFGAIDRCQELLDGTAGTLLNDLLLSYTHQFQDLLHDILELAVAADQAVAEAVAHRTAGHVDRIAAWGSARQAAWSEYYEHVHRYLRDVVRLDPSRALTQRLREQLNGHERTPFSLTVADAPPLLVLRTVIPPPPPAPVRRPRGERSAPPTETAPEAEPDPLGTRVRELISSGSRELSELTSQATEVLPSEQQFAGAGKVAELAARLAAPRLSRQRPWVAVREGLVIEDWQLETATMEAAAPTMDAPAMDSPTMDVAEVEPTDTVDLDAILDTADLDTDTAELDPPALDSAALDTAALADPEQESRAKADE
jgi:chromosome partition protein MukF